ncbi:hypothetical protein A5821_002031 [Enterococcus sp. 7F3_DIV0205]|uniref:Uncharacterized protein n=1 Tax=Candidatus Enterococcus palustris TaxID=1834189 RepID=A0AAQ3Y5C7_9ENTE|nr:hypothetical protein [Enterococcus sp. 7F3_DIV0205]OTN82470.1 hypothetical protein A5821_002381 [Enterococcus sp. 7F3_DIV0205]
MRNYLWIYILGVIAASSFFWFIITLSRDIVLVKKLKLAKASFMLNFTLLFISLSSVGLIIYLFTSLKEQIKLLG